MTLDQQSINEEALHRQLYELRREGFEGVELRKVPQLVAVAERLAPAESDQRRQLEISIELAIRDLSEHQEVALPWFGLTDATRGKSKDEREKAAADACYVSVPAFKTHRQKGLVEGIRRALLRRYEPPPVPDLGEASDEEPGVPDLVLIEGPERPGRGIAGIGGGGGILLLVLIGLAILIFGWPNWGEGPNPTKEVPPVGTVVSAQDGSIAALAKQPEDHQLISIESENAFRVCDLTKVESEDKCVFRSVTGPIRVQSGDVLWLGRSLREEGEVPLPSVALAVRRHWESNHSAAAEIVVEWPKAGVHQGKERDANKIVFEMPGEYGYVNLVYVPGSTELRGPSWQDFIAHLPDGIMEEGIALANLGPPVSCFQCFDKYKRYVFFKAKLEGYDQRSK
jgi:hypothetical protein